MTFVTGTWSDEELETVVAMAAAGEPKAEIAKVVNRDYRSVVSKLAHLARKARQADKPQLLCLKCHKPFPSEWEGNRLCKRHQ